MVGPKQWVLLLSDALLIFLTFATHNAFAQNNQTDPVGLTILGEVILEDSNRPAAGVVVTAKAMENPSTVSALTNENASKAQRLQLELPAICLIFANIHAKRRMVREQLRDLETYLTEVRATGTKAGDGST